jgi:hypothetical protein
VTCGYHTIRTVGNLVVSRLLADRARPKACVHAPLVPRTVHKSCMWRCAPQMLPSSSRGVTTCVCKSSIPPNSRTRYNNSCVPPGAYPLCRRFGAIPDQSASALAKPFLTTIS